MNSLTGRAVQIDKAIHQTLTKIDRQIQENLKNSAFETRPTNSNGLWCCLLIPTIMVFYSMAYMVSPLYKQMALLSIGILCYNILLILFTTVSSLVLTELRFGPCMVSGLVSTLLLHIFGQMELWIALIISMTTICLYGLLLRLLIICPKTFTIGELMVLLQGFILSYVACVSKILHGPITSGEDFFVDNVVVTVLSTVGLIVTALYYMNYSQRDLKHLEYILAAAVAFVIIVLHLQLGYTCVYQIINYFFMDMIRANLICFWLLLCVITVYLLVSQTKKNMRADTVTRKSFHILASIVFLSGIICDLQFMKLASAVALGLLVFIEALRKSKIEPISSHLQDVFEIYKDEKDCGEFAMTPIYLLMGLACPLALVPGGGSGVGDSPARAWALPVLSGVLSTGVGDAAASWFGKRYGSRRWPGGTRTYEGTFFNILSQLTAVYILQLFNLIGTPFAIPRTMVAASLAALVEARTDQVDNLVLPMVMLIGYQIAGALL